MKFGKYNNPNRRRSAKRRSPYSKAYIAERKQELEELLATAKTESERKMLRDAFDITINPVIRH